MLYFLSPLVLAQMDREEDKRDTAYLRKDYDSFVYTLLARIHTQTLLGKPGAVSRRKRGNEDNGNSFFFFFCFCKDGKGKGGQETGSSAVDE